MKWKNKCKVFGFRLMAVCVLFLCTCIHAQAGTLYESDYVKFSPDGTAWTFAEDLPDGYVAIPEETGLAASKKAGVYFDASDNFSTGITSTREEAGVGQHEYSYKRIGEVPVGAWKVSHEESYCSHTLSRYPVEWHGLVADTILEAKDNGGFRIIRCGWRYYSGWNAICADCGGKVMERNIYGSKDAVKSVTSIDTSLAHYYLCPSCSHLEQAVEEPHRCIGVSYNKYAIRYVANDDSDGMAKAQGTMSMSFHMYSNATVYEGVEVIPQKTLNLNNYTRKGFAFKEWNTKPDGSGTSYADGAEIFNLTDENYNEDTGEGIVTLYAQWVTSESTLKIDAAGGTYNRVPVFTKTAGYGTKYMVDESLLVPPTGCTITYNLNGGEQNLRDGKTILQDVVAKKFDGWRKSTPFHGRMKDNEYAFLGDHGTTDTLTATYTSGSVVLPQPKKTGYAFGGWFLDEGCETQPVGMHTEVYTPPSDKSEVTLYAKWVGLILWSTPDLTVDGGKGGVDLAWAQQDANDKIYRIYQSPSGAEGTYKQINTTTQKVEDMVVQDASFHCIIDQRTQSYEVKSDGYYTITATGASGKNFEGTTFKGGRGGVITATFYLEKGDKLSIHCGLLGGGGWTTNSAEGTNGGEETIVASEKKGVLLIAGGGGGAMKYADGICGGGLSETIADGGTTGKNGVAGSGGGAVPGNAGSYTMAHTHDTTCYHVHSGNAVSGGECYKTAATIPCGEYGLPSETWYGYEPGGPDGTCIQCHQPAEGHGNTHYLARRQCGTCGAENTQSNPNRGLWPVMHNEPGFSLSCGMTEATLICNRTESIGVITAAQGGMNYVAPGRLSVTSNPAGSSTAGYGSGTVQIKAVGVGCTEACRLEDVSANDKEAPEKIPSYHTEGAGGNRVLVTWQKPKDNGTPYYHKAESYSLNTEDTCTSNVRRDVITTGVKGYYYIVNTNSGTLVNTSNADNKNALLTQDMASDECALRVVMTNDVQYLHLVAVDVAGNLDTNKTVHIRIDGAALDYPIMTRQISVTGVIGTGAGARDYGSVYRVSGTNNYYVRADGQTPFLVSGSSYMDGIPRANYMIDYQLLKVSMDTFKQEFITRLPYSPIPNSTGENLDPADFVRRVSGSSILTDAMYIGATRSGDCKTLNFYQAFTVDEAYNGKQLFVMPGAGITTNNPGAEENIVYSVAEKDTLNGVTLIPDAEAPIIGGMDAFAGADVVNREKFSGMNLTVRDELSGLEKCKVTIESCNIHYNAVATYETDSLGKLSIDFTEDREVFEGDFKITIEACDKVGNKITKKYGNGAIGLTASISRILEPHAPVFKCGESGVLTIEAAGDVKRIEVEFPGEMVALCPELNQTFRYADGDNYQRSEELQFMVPLYTPEGDYTVTVRAVGEKSTKEVYPTLTVIEGGNGVLGELRTRLR